MHHTINNLYNTSKMLHFPPLSRELSSGVIIARSITRRYFPYQIIQNNIKEYSIQMNVQMLLWPFGP